MQKKNEYDNSNVNSLRHIKTDESKESYNYKNILIEKIKLQILLILKVPKI